MDDVQQAINFWDLEHLLAFTEKRKYRVSEDEDSKEEKICHNETEFLSTKLSKNRHTKHWNALSFAEIIPKVSENQHCGE